jgi:peptidoglycan/LPS O-acetylase OafA/YrhL
VSQTPQREHVAALDGVRGLASAAVVVAHVFAAVAMPDSVRRAMLASPLAVLLNGLGAVQLFYVLSGYVLASSLSRNRRGVDLAQFYVKRFFRIQPPYAAAVLLAWCASFFYGLQPAASGLTGWIRQYALVHVAPAELLPWLLLPSTAESQLPVGWTLTIEFFYSILLPAMALLGRPFGGILLLIASSWLLVRGFPSPVLMCSIDFTLGLLAFRHRERLRPLLARLPGWAVAVGITTSLVLFAAPKLFLWRIPPVGDPASIGTMGIGSLGIIAFAAFSPTIGRALAARWVVFLGRISYSLYLVHMTVLLLCIRPIAGRLSLPEGLLLLAVVMAGSIGLSMLLYRVAERPSILLGNRICVWLARRTHAAALESEIVRH